MFLNKGYRFIEIDESAAVYRLKNKTKSLFLSRMPRVRAPVVVACFGKIFRVCLQGSIG